MEHHRSEAAFQIAWHNANFAKTAHEISNCGGQQSGPCDYADDSAWPILMRNVYKDYPSKQRSYYRYKKDITNALGRSIEGVAGDDGNCFYLSLKRCLEAINNQGRNDTVDQMKVKVHTAMQIWFTQVADDEQRETFLSAAMGDSDGRFQLTRDLDQDFTRYLLHINRPGEYATGRSISFIPELYNVIVHIIPSDYLHRPQTFSSPQATVHSHAHIYIWYTGLHFEPMIENKYLQACIPRSIRDYKRTNGDPESLINILCMLGLETAKPPKNRIGPRPNYLHITTPVRYPLEQNDWKSTSTAAERHASAGDRTNRRGRNQYEPDVPSTPESSSVDDASWRQVQKIISSRRESGRVNDHRKLVPPAAKRHAEVNQDEDMVRKIIDICEGFSAVAKQRDPTKLQRQEFTDLICSLTQTANSITNPGLKELALQFLFTAGVDNLRRTP